MLQKIELKNFKCFESLDRACSPLTLLCGLNGMGKSNVTIRKGSPPVIPPPTYKSTGILSFPTKEPPPVFPDVRNRESRIVPCRTFSSLSVRQLWLSLLGGHAHLAEVT